MRISITDDNFIPFLKEYVDIKKDLKNKFNSIKKDATLTTKDSILKESADYIEFRNKPIVQKALNTQKLYEDLSRTYLHLTKKISYTLPEALFLKESYDQILNIKEDEDKEYDDPNNSLTLFFGDSADILPSTDSTSEFSKFKLEIDPTCSKELAKKISAVKDNISDINNDYEKAIQSNDTGGIESSLSKLIMTSEIVNRF